MTEARHPITDRPYLRYCPSCGSTDLHRPIVDRLVCKTCGFELYFNAASAVIGLITDEQGRLLVTIRAREPAKGRMGLPGGFVDLGETAEQALAREIKEELGLELARARFLCTEPNVYLYKGVTYVTVDMAFVCKVMDPNKAAAADDVLQIMWLYPSQIRPEDFGFRSMANVFKRFVHEGLGPAGPCDR